MTRPFDRVLVTGATGFIGRALCARLRKECTQLLGLARHVPPGVQGLVAGDIRAADHLGTVFEQFRPTHVFHLAASRDRTAPVGELSQALEVNALGTVNVVASAAAVGCSRVVVVGTAEEYGNITSPFFEDDTEQPESVYGISKLAGTRLGLSAGRLGGTEVTVVRPTVAYGPGQPPDMFLPALIRALLSGIPFPMTGGDQTRDFVFINDLVDGLLRAGVSPKSAGLVVNLGSGETVSIRHCAEIAERIIGSSGLLQLGAVPLRLGEPFYYAVDLTRARQTLDWKSQTTLEEGLAETVGSMRE